MKWLLIAALTLVGLVAAEALNAQPPAVSPPPPPHAASTARDTTHFLPPWLRGWLEFGGGWMAGPSYLKRHYESGQSFAAGLEARPRPRWALRTAVDYQMVLAHARRVLYVPYLDPLDPRVVYVDTVHFETQTTGWIAGSRTEVGARLPGDFWLTAGAGGGYMHSGLGGDASAGFSDVGMPTSDAVANGWGWLWTAAVRYDFTPAPRVPLGLDVRTSELRRGHDAVRTWSVRMCFRMPEDLPPGTPAPRRR